MSGPVEVWADGHNLDAPWCGTTTWAALGNPYAVTCRKVTGTDIRYGWVFVNKNGYNWEYADVGYDSSDPRVGFQGTLTHEFGHVGGLDEEHSACNAGTAMETMCGAATKQETFYLVLPVVSAPGATSAATSSRRIKLISDWFQVRILAPLPELTLTSRHRHHEAPRVAGR